MKQEEENILNRKETQEDLKLHTLLLSTTSAFTFLSLLKSIKSPKNHLIEWRQVQEMLFKTFPILIPGEFEAVFILD